MVRLFVPIHAPFIKEWILEPPNQLQMTRKKIKHWGLNLVEPGQRYSAADFKKYAKAAIADIQSRGKLPVLVGGSGLYIDSVLFDYQFSEPGAERDAKNPRHLKKAIQPNNKRILPNTLIVGIRPTDEVLKERIAKRAEAMFAQGIINESRELFQKYGLKKFEGTSGIAYQSAARLMQGKITQQQATEEIKKAEWQYARRQKTWFKRNEYIKWFNSSQAAEKWLKNSY